MGSLKDLEEIFSPGAAIGSIEQFCGRTDQLERASKALRKKGISLTIYGFRGVGKSSLGYQVISMARRDKSFEDMEGEVVLPKKKFHVTYCSVAFGVSDVNGIILEVLSAPDGVGEHLPAEQKTEVRDIKLGVGIGSAKLGGGKSVSQVTQGVRSQISSLLLNSITRQKKDSGLDCLIVIDELDRVADKSGLAELIKACEKYPVKFVLIGISTDIERLLDDHTSIKRQLRGGTILVPPMTQDETREIMVQANSDLAGRIEFSTNSIDYIVNLSEGHPYLVHCIGDACLDLAQDMGRKIVTERMANKAMQNLASDESFDLEASYRKAVKGSAYREYVLKAFAETKDSEMRTKEVYSRIESETFIERASIGTFTGHLAKEEYGSPIENIRHGVYQFTDNIFKVYCRSRPFSYWEIK